MIFGLARINQQRASGEKKEADFKTKTTPFNPIICWI